MVKISEIATMTNHTEDEVLVYLRNSQQYNDKIHINLLGSNTVDGEINEILNYIQYVESHEYKESKVDELIKEQDAQENELKKKQAEQIIAQAEAAASQAELESAAAKVLVTSGNNFEGFRIVKYSGYISGDDAISVSRGFDGFLSKGTNIGESLLKSLTVIRRNALKELREAAAMLGCNAVICVDFDYISLDPQTANSSGGTTYYPYVFCVTANGTAVRIEKE